MNPILLEFPTPIVTERLQIRQAVAGEGAIVNAAIGESFSELHKWMVWAKTMPTVEESEAFTRESAAKFMARTEFALRIWDRADDHFLGSIGLHPKRWAPPRTFEIGYWVRTSEAGRGIATEAARAVEHVAFDVLKANRVYIRCDDRNVASARVAEKLGFALEGIIRCDEADNAGGFRDTRVYAKVCA